ncbi:type II toxin-antitoxin system VapC family toxin [Spirosoma sp. KCTC 42546]|uniref:type II toxin-antitoxin system VapC family toxin n=1 Tax=Spirosoma sp. KCTC 42546 TaxID=2520506 RepID=UPI00115962BC|nr:type II toxin-antitoxin system VapC family toxin [Spirosoma sp. KCTC 42546]QDK82592.1 type II toxin-antitoxin system VapC family toxin [Spirosoma sp. KCTC 42546]
MKILLDTQALIWSLNDSDKLTKTARTFIQEADTVYVSPINFYEIAIKTALGRDPGIKWPIHDIIQEALLSDFIWLPLSANHIEAYTQLPFYENHRDPFDRIILATALADDLTIVSSDHNFPLYTDLVTTIW